MQAPWLRAQTNSRGRVHRGSVVCLDADLPGSVGSDLCAGPVAQSHAFSNYKYRRQTLQPDQALTSAEHGLCGAFCPLF